MSSKKTKLELTWIGKEHRPKLEPRILLEEPERSHHAAQRITDGDLFDNLLIQGDNLLALKALEQNYAGKVKCIYIDPPYNTGSAFEHYDDSMEHSIWLSLMRDRISILRSLLDRDGLIFVQIDDNELAYLTILMDELFGRTNRINTICVKMSEATGVKMAHTEKRLPKLKEYILVYRKDEMPILTTEMLPLEAWNPEYKIVMLGLSRQNAHEIKRLRNQDVCDLDDVEQAREILKLVTLQSISRYFTENGIAAKDQEQWRWENAWRIVEPVGSDSVRRLVEKEPTDGPEVAAIRSNKGVLCIYNSRFDRTTRAPRIRLLFAEDYLTRHPGDFWQDIKTSGGVGQEGSVLFPNGKKPEALLKRIIGMCTKPGDLVLDSFLGSGTTAAVAHKMGRRWIGIELGEHCHTHCLPRLKKVVDGEDAGGITQTVGWKGGGGFRYYRLAPSLLEKDKWDQWVIHQEFNAAMLAEAVCKLEGFTYAPSDTLYWQHGHSTEQDFLYTTTANLSHDQLQQLSDEVGPERSLLVVCSAFRGRQEGYPNLTVKKIPKTVLSRCEWGKDDYSLKVENLPKAPPEPGQIDLF